MSEDITTTEYTLEKIKEKIFMRLGPERFEQLRIDVRGEYYDDLSLHIERTLYGERIVNEQQRTVRVPATWWQHFKLENFPKWILRKYPVSYKSITVTVEFGRHFDFPKCYVPNHSYLSKFVVRDLDPTVRVENPFTGDGF